MRLLTWASIGVLSLTLGISAAGAQDEPKPQPEEPKPAQNETKPTQTPADQDKQEMKQDQNQPQENQVPKQNPSKEEKQQQKDEKQQQKDDAKAAKDNSRPQGQMNQGQANQAQANHGQPAGGQSGHIPDKDFKAHFGRQHTVVIHQPVIVEGQPRFQYAGYWFVISDPWPAGWAYTDSCYIDYVDGEYFLFDLLHPGVRIALFVVVA
jgi:hypothetical protein